MSEEADSEVLNGLKGRSILDWRCGEGGMHLELDDGRIVVFAVLGGTLVIGVYTDGDHVVH